MSKLKLYDVIESQNGYKVRLLLSHLQIDYDFCEVDVINGEHKQDYFLKLSPNGQIPTLVDEDFSIWESNAIILYLGKKFSQANLISEDPIQYGQMMEWLFFESCKLQPCIQFARFHTMFAPKFFPDMKIDDVKLNIERKKAASHLTVLNNYLGNNDFLSGQYSLADIACYCQIFPAEEGKIDLSKYLNIHSWQKRIESKSGYVSMRDKVAVKTK